MDLSKIIEQIEGKDRPYFPSAGMQCNAIAQMFVLSRGGNPLVAALECLKIFYPESDAMAISALEGKTFGEMQASLLAQLLHYAAASKDFCEEDSINFRLDSISPAFSHGFNHFRAAMPEQRFADLAGFVAGCMAAFFLGAEIASRMVRNNNDEKEGQ